MAMNAMQQHGYGGVTATLPAGLWLNGALYRQTSLRPLMGHDEAFLVEQGPGLLPAQRSTALLARCLTGLDTLDLAQHDPATLVRDMTIGDREALLLHVRRLNFGDRMPSVLRCPQPGCGQPMDLELHVEDMLLPPYSDVVERREAVLVDADVQWQVVFRLPNGADQEAAAQVVQHSPQAAADLILQRCVLGITTAAGQVVEESGQNLPEVVRRDLPPLLASLDPQAEMLLRLACVECGSEFTALFDTATFLLQEIGQRSAQLFREVHTLASYYHWSESEILSMTMARRQRYVALLDEALGG